jgi:hypothetical protein
MRVRNCQFFDTAWFRIRDFCIRKDFNSVFGDLIGHLRVLIMRISRQHVKARIHLILLTPNAAHSLDLFHNVCSYPQVPSLFPEVSLMNSSIWY